VKKKRSSIVYLSNVSRVLINANILRDVEEINFQHSRMVRMARG
jgi:hypothetical protein